MVPTHTQTAEERAMLGEHCPRAIARAAFLLDAWLAETGQENERLRFHDIRVLQPGQERTRNPRVSLQTLAEVGYREAKDRMVAAARSRWA